MLSSHLMLFRVAHHFLTKDSRTATWQAFIYNLNKSVHLGIRKRKQIYGESVQGSTRFFYEFLAYSQKCEGTFQHFFFAIAFMAKFWLNCLTDDRPLQLHHKTGKQNNEKSQKMLLNATSCCHGSCYHFPLCMKLDLCHLSNFEMTDMSMEVYTTWFALVWMSELLNWVGA